MRRTLIVVAMLGATCAHPARPSLPAAVVIREVPIACMSEPPKFYIPTWPTPDRLGNMIIHASTVEGIKNALAEERGYIDRQFFRCRYLAEDGNPWRQR